MSSYERGTPQGPLSRKARWTILVLLTLVVTFLATLATWGNGEDIIRKIGSALIGCLCVLVPLVFNEWHIIPFFLVHSMTLLTIYTNQTKLNVDMMYHALALTACVALVAFVPTILQAFCDMMFQFILVSTIGGLLTFSYALASCVQSGSPVLPAWLAIFTLGLLGLWYSHRTRRHGNLIFMEQTRHSISAAGALGLMAFLSLHHQGHLDLFLPLLMGAVVTVLSCATLACVADVWWSVGSGQFWMISLDTSSMVLYLVLPAILLGYRANDKYGTTVRIFLGTTVLPTHLRFANPLFATTCAVILMGLTICVGVPLIAMLCPLGAHFFGKVYTCGQASTRKVALCMDWSDEITEEALVNMKNHSIVFLVTREQLKSNSLLIQKVAKMGHSFEITLDGVADLLETYQLYETILSHTPEWWCPGKQSWNPHDVHNAANLNLKVGLWSHKLAVTGTLLSATQAKELLTELDTTMGGSILYLTGTRKNPLVLPVAKTIVTDFTRNGFSFCPLSLVAKNDLKMELAPKE